MNCTQREIKTIPDSPSIYVSCLASYNDGRLIGDWIDASQGYDAVMEEINAMLKRSPEPFAEEFAIHDTSGFCGARVGEYDSIKTVCELAEKIEEYEREGQRGEVFAKLYCDYDIECATDMMEENYIGCFESSEDFAGQYIEDCCFLEGVHESVKRYFDYEAFARDMEYGGDVFCIETGYKEKHYFHSR